MNNRTIRPNIILAALAFLCLSLHGLAQQATFPAAPPEPDSLTDSEADEWTRLLQEHAQAFDAAFSQKAAAAAEAYAAADQLSDAAKKDTLMTKAEIDSLSSLAREAKKTDREAGRQAKQASKALAFAEKVAEMDTEGRRKNLSKCYRQLKELDELLHPENYEKPIAAIIGTEGVVTADSLPPALPEAVQEAPAPKTTDRSTRPVTPYDPKKDVMLNPPEKPCALARNTRDEFSGELYRELRREELFRYTNDVMKKLLPPGQPHIVCEAALSAAGESVSLHLQFSIRDNNVRRSFGSLAKNSIAVLKLIDGTTITLYSQRNDDGYLDPETQIYRFQGQYPVEASALKKIRKSELDKLRIAWGTGYEDYEVQNIDLLMRQARCLFE
ncbi:MAG: hypothetical protein H6575_04080 [Lewinellaceae bacterium]|nr:hypothetical protein [Lewinellaceae bacterium]